MMSPYPFTERFLAVHSRAKLVSILGQGRIEVMRLPANLQQDPSQRTLASVYADKLMLM
jgi:hypothetical protein